MPATRASRYVAFAVCELGVRTGANAEIAPALARLRDRSRDLVRNNPYAAKAVTAARDASTSARPAVCSFSRDSRATPPASGLSSTLAASSSRTWLTG
jgi:capsid protein